MGWELARDACVAIQSPAPTVTPLSSIPIAVYKLMLYYSIVGNCQCEGSFLMVGRRDYARWGLHTPNWSSKEAFPVYPTCFENTDATPPIPGTLNWGRST